MITSIISRSLRASPMLRTWSLLQRRRMSSSRENSVAASVADTKLMDILQTNKLSNMQNVLVDLHRPYVTHSEFADLCRAQGLNGSLESIEVFNSLQNCGFLLPIKGNFNGRPIDVILLHPTEIRERVKRSTRDCVRSCNKFTTNDVILQAKNTANGLALLGLFSSFAYLSIFARLIWWDLSWDVMEPVSYIAGSVSSLSALIYYLRSRIDFDYENWYNLRSKGL